MQVSPLAHLLGEIYSSAEASLIFFFFKISLMNFSMTNPQVHPCQASRPSGFRMPITHFSKTSHRYIFAKLPDHLAGRFFFFFVAEDDVTTFVANAHPPHPTKYTMHVKQNTQSTLINNVYYASSRVDTRGIAHTHTSFGTNLKTCKDGTPKIV